MSQNRRLVEIPSNNTKKSGGVRPDKKRSASHTCPPVEYINRVTCPTRQQFYKELQQQSKSDDPKKCSGSASKLNWSYNSNKIHKFKERNSAAASDYTDETFRVKQCNSMCKSRHKLRQKTSVSQRKLGNQRKDKLDDKIDNQDLVEQPPPITREEHDTQTNESMAFEPLWKDIKRDSENSGGLSPRLKYGLFKIRSGRRSIDDSRKSVHSYKPEHPWSQKTYKMTQLRNLCSTEVMHLDIKPENRFPHYPTFIPRKKLARSYILKSPSPVMRHAGHASPVTSILSKRYSKTTTNNRQRTPKKNARRRSLKYKREIPFRDIRLPIFKRNVSPQFASPQWRTRASQSPSPSLNSSYHSLLEEASGKRMCNACYKNSMAHNIKPILKELNPVEIGHIICKTRNEMQRKPATANYKKIPIKSNLTAQIRQARSKAQNSPIPLSCPCRESVLEREYGEYENLIKRLPLELKHFVSYSPIKEYMKSPNKRLPIAIKRNRFSKKEIDKI